MVHTYQCQHCGHGRALCLKSDHKKNNYVTTEQLHMPVTFKICLSFYSVKGYFNGQVRPKTGAPPLFSKELEGDLALFMKHCSLL